MAFGTPPDSGPSMTPVITTSWAKLAGTAATRRVKIENTEKLSTDRRGRWNCMLEPLEFIVLDSCF
jgi:hypothetical protein